ncbi:MAG TPA: alpha/beta hydrolase [Iamia sp.]|nr:alpha/beta hydrolase [Iamia sp.]
MGRTRTVTLVMACALVLGTTACEPSTPTEPSPPGEATAPLTSCGGRRATTTRDIAYATVPAVDPNLLALDLTVPVRGGRCGPAPVVVWVHGGAFSVGDKANGVAAMTTWATEQGWAFASVNHRLSPRPPSDAPGRVLHPTHVTDVAAAVGWLVDHASDRGLDADRILLVGHSAGAFLVSLLATDARYLAAAGVDLDQVRAVAALDTRYDIAAEIADDDVAAEAMYRTAFGDEPDVWHEASPATHAGSHVAEPPFVVVTRGQAERMSSARSFAAALDEATVVDANPLGHAQVGAALGGPGDGVVTPTVTAVFRRALDVPIATRR